MKGQLGGAGAALLDRDRLLLEAVADLRLVTGTQLTRLFFNGPAASSVHPRIARRTMERLTDHGLLTRLQRRVGGHTGGSSSYVYTLTPAGRTAIGRPLRRGQVREPSLTFLAHHLGIAEVYVRLHEAHQQGELVDLRLTTEPACWRPLSDGSGGVLKPDLFAVIGTEQDELLTFIEVDNGTEHAAALRRKLDLYQAHFASGVEQRTEGVFPEVLWVTETPERASALEHAAARGPSPQLHRVLLLEHFIHYVTKGEPL